VNNACDRTHLSPLATAAAPTAIRTEGMAVETRRWPAGGEGLLEADAALPRR
jgi:hypothetical protein